MGTLQEEQEIVGEQIFKEVIYKKHNTGIKTKQICQDLNLDRELVSDYLEGISKKNFPLGILILDYLDKKEQENNNLDIETNA